MHDFEQQLLDGLQRCQLANCHALMAVSGGADSVAMLRGIHSLSGEHNLRIAAAHLNHALRGDEADDDENWLRELFEELRIPFKTSARDVNAYAEENGISIEEAARTVRYAFLEETAEALGCTAIVVAHTADDQAETILHHIVRGAGIAGLRGMKWSRTLPSGLKIVRPLLRINRETIEVYLNQIGQCWRDDATNSDASYTRNRIRHHLLPLLQDNYNPRVGDALRKLGQQAEEIEAALDQLASNILVDALADRTPETVRLNCALLCEQPSVIVRHCFTAIWKQQHWPRQQMGFSDWNRLAEIVNSEATAITLPGNIEARRRGDLLILRQL